MALVYPERIQAQGPAAARLPAYMPVTGMLSYEHESARPLDWHAIYPKGRLQTSTEHVGPAAAKALQDIEYVEHRCGNLVQYIFDRKRRGFSQA
jgi:hypothetical protein